MSTFDHEYEEDGIWLELAFSVVMRDGSSQRKSSIMPEPSEDVDAMKWSCALQARQSIPFGKIEHSKDHLGL